MSRLCLYDINEPERDRWIPGDRFVRPVVRRIVRGRPRPGGLDKVFVNLQRGLDLLSIPYEVNLPFRNLRSDDRVAVFGRGHHCLNGYDRPNKIVAGIGLMTHPSEWPTLCNDYPVARYLQHSEWCDRIYRPYFGGRCAIWPVGIDTKEWAPQPAIAKTNDFLIYDKIHWEHEQRETDLLSPIQSALATCGLSWETLRYGQYRPGEYRAALARCRAMIFLSAHESQGIACEEAMSSNVPVFAWDPGFVQDPERFRWGQPVIPSTSVPYFDARCGLKYSNATEFAQLLPQFLAALETGQYSPRNYILENLTLERCAKQFSEIVTSSL